LMTSRQTDPLLSTATRTGQLLIPFVVIGKLDHDDSHLIDIGVKDPVHKPNRRRFVRVLRGEFHVNLPAAKFKRSYLNAKIFISK